MKPRTIMTEEQLRVLAKARETYGNDQQVVIAMGELSELVTAISKYPRYSSDHKEQAREDLHDAVLDEVADVFVVLDHVINIFDLSYEEIQAQVTKKVSRVGRWLSSSNSMEQTIVDRALVDQKPTLDDKIAAALCSSCAYKHKKAIAPGNATCSRCNPGHKSYVKSWSCSGCKQLGEYRNLQPGGICLKCAEEGGSQYKSKDVKDFETD